MRLLIAGSYGITISVEELDQIIRRKFEIEDITEVFCDTRMEILGQNWANVYNTGNQRFINFTTLHQKSKEQLGDYADQALILKNGKFGSGGITDYMRKIGKQCKITFVEERAFLEINGV